MSGSNPGTILGQTIPDPGPDAPADPSLLPDVMRSGGYGSQLA
jgi:hypothetical protein